MSENLLHGEAVVPLLEVFRLFWCEMGGGNGVEVGSGDAHSLLHLVIRGTTPGCPRHRNIAENVERNASVQAADKGDNFLHLVKSTEIGNENRTRPYFHPGLMRSPEVFVRGAAGCPVYSRWSSSSNALKLTLLPSRSSNYQTRAVRMAEACCQPEFPFAKRQEIGKLRVGGWLSTHEMNSLQIKPSQAVLDLLNGRKVLGRGFSFNL